MTDTHPAPARYDVTRARASIVAALDGLWAGDESEEAIIARLCSALTDLGGTWQPASDPQAPTHSGPEAPHHQTDAGADTHPDRRPPPWQPPRPDRPWRAVVTTAVVTTAVAAAVIVFIAGLQACSGGGPTPTPPEPVPTAPYSPIVVPTADLTDTITGVCVDIDVPAAVAELSRRVVYDDPIFGGGAIEDVSLSSHPGLCGTDVHATWPPGRSTAGIPGFIACVVGSRCTDVDYYSDYQLTSARVPGHDAHGRPYQVWSCLRGEKPQPAQTSAGPVCLRALFLDDDTVAVTQQPIPCFDTSKGRICGDRSDQR